MSILEIEKEVSQLSLREKRKLSSWLLECLEELEDEEAVRAARAEGGKPIPWEQVKKEMHLDEL